MVPAVRMASSAALASTFVPSDAAPRHAAVGGEDVLRPVGASRPAGRAAVGHAEPCRGSSVTTIARVSRACGPGSPPARRRTAPLPPARWRRPSMSSSRISPVCAAAAAPPSAGGRIRLAVAEAALLSGLHGVPRATEQETDIRPRRLCGKPCRNGFGTADQPDRVCRSRFPAAWAVWQTVSALCRKTHIFL